MIVQSRGQIYAMSCICAVIMNVGANVSSAENSDAAMSVNFINQENVKNQINLLMCAMDAARERIA